MPRITRPIDDAPKTLAPPRPARRGTVTLIVDGEIVGQSALFDDAFRVFEHLRDIYEHEIKPVHLSLENDSGVMVAWFYRSDKLVVSDSFTRRIAQEHKRFLQAKAKDDE